MMKLVVLSCLLAAASAGLIAPLAYTAPLAYGAPLWAPSNYRGPLSLAPGQPANILAADGRPLDTLDVNLDRSAHYTAKALNGIHLLKKRSVVAPVVAAPIARIASPLIAHAAPLAYTAPLAYAAPLWASSNYRGPLSLAPGQPANILAADGRPLDTLDVNLDRSAHYTAKALDGIHLLKKRSIVAPVIAAPIAPIASPLIAHTAPIAYGARLAAVAHLAPIAYGHSTITHVL